MRVMFTGEFGRYVLALIRSTSCSVPRQWSLGRSRRRKVPELAREPAHVLELRRALGGSLAACRQKVRWSQAKLARELSYHRSAISHIESGRHPAPREFWKRADEVLHADGALLAGYETLATAKRDAAAHDGPEPPEPEPAGGPVGPAAVPTTGTPSSALSAEGGTTRTGRRTALKLSLTVAVAPEILNRVLSEAAAEAMEFTRMAGISSVGRGTLEHLELVINDLNRGYSHEPPAELFAVARAYRSRVDDLIRGRHTLKELRELYVYAGCLSESLAWLAHDLGNPRTARAYAVDSYTHAEQAGHGELCGWATDAMTAIATYAEHPDGAVRVAKRGIAQVSPTHPLAVRLRAKAARAYARLGDREKFEILFAEACRLHDQLPTQTPIRFTLDTAAMASYAIAAHPAQGYLWLGDFRTGKKYAEAALAVHESAAPGGSSTGKGAIARLNLATALAHLGAPDEAVALGRQALISTCAATFVRTHVHDLDAALVGSYPTLTCVRDFHDQYRQLPGL